MTVGFRSRITTQPVNITTGALSPIDASLSNSRGTVVLTGATPVTIADSYVTANSSVIFTLKTVGGTVGAYPVIQTITPGTGFTVQGTALDTSTYTYRIQG